MPVIKLADGSERIYDSPVTAYSVAKDIANSLAKAALAAKINDKLVDLSYLITSDVNLQIVTNKDSEGLEVIRHSCAHLMAQAVQILFPDAQVTIGPVIEDGFYYDFSYKKGFTEEDLALIEKKMQDLVKQNLEVKRSILTRDNAVKLFEEKNEKYKVEIIKDIPGDLELSFYQQGDFIDLCRGPHVPSTGKIKAFKLMKVAGAYWRGDSNNEMLQRIYGTAWADKNQLKEYLHRLEEAQKRDHRKAIKKLDLCHLQEEAQGMIFWHPKGWTTYQIIESYIREKLNKNGYKEIKTPQIIDRTLWEKSGHWEIFQENMFTLTSDENHYAIKPMNCPGHIQVFNQGIKSYRDLPLRFAEFGCCHRYEPSGALHGMMRLRNFVQDDAHIFCSEDNIQAEVVSFIDLLYDVYADFGFTDIIVRLSTRPEKRVGTDEIWDKAEDALAKALKESGLEYELYPGEGAFYGPKIEFALKDCLGRIWQCGTMQVDFSMPGRLGANYIAEDGSKKVPVMLHRAILGSIERFFGIMLEETAGSLPLWLAPVQAMIMNITDEHKDYAENLSQELNNQGFRVETDLRNEKIGFKIREHTIARVPYLLVVGSKEVSDKTVSVRTREGEDLGSIKIVDFVSALKDNIKLRGRNKLSEQKKTTVIV